MEQTIINKINAKILVFEKEIKKIENNGHGLQGKKFKRTCGKFFCGKCHEVGELYIKSNLLRELLK